MARETTPKVRDEGSERMPTAAHLMVLERILTEYTDENNAITNEEILAHMERAHAGLKRQALYRLMEQLDVYYETIYGQPEEPASDRFSYIIENTERKSHTFALSPEVRNFSTAQYKILADAVQSAKFITDTQSRALLERLARLSSRYERQNVRQQTVLSGRVKSEQTQVFDNVDVLNRAILGDHMVTFRYYRFDENKKRRYGHDGKLYRINPWNLTWDDGKYYLIGDDIDQPDDKRNIRHYRVDKMEYVSETAEKRSFCPAFEHLDTATYCSELFSMYGGEIMDVHLMCENSMANVIIDRFGGDEVFHRLDDGHFTVWVRVRDSDMFFGWILSLGGRVRVTEPAKAVERITSLAANYLNNGGNTK